MGNIFVFGWFLGRGVVRRTDKTRLQALLLVPNELSDVIGYCKELRKEHDEFLEKQKSLDKNINKIFYDFYKEFTAKNWGRLSKNVKYYMLSITIFDEPQYREIYFDRRISDVFCTFVYANPNISASINQFSDVKEEDYDSNCVIIDREQLERIKENNQLELKE